ncbi:MAG: helix-turn-helix transcriptional regulator [Oscillospiraceae bacterium]|nr:helix-turn-helix transcriptional regulator [Oscillospiraceae bacterium]
MEEKNTRAAILDAQAVETIRSSMLTPALLSGAVAFGKAVADPTRMRILYALAKKEVCVGDLAAALEMTKSAVSHQLRALRGEGLVRARRAGKNIYYALDDQHVVDVLETMITHVRHKLEHEE